MTTLEKIITSINLGNEPIKRVFRGHGANVIPAKCIFFRKGGGDFSLDFNLDFSKGVAGSPIRIYDKALFRLSVGTLRFPVQGATLTASVLSKIRHGDGEEEDIAYSGNSTITISANTSGSERSGRERITQAESGLYEYIEWVQDADSVLSYGDVEILTFAYSDIDVFGNVVTPTYTYRQAVHWASGQTTYITSGASVTFDGIGVGADGSVGGVTLEDETERTLIATSTILITGQGSKSAQMSVNVYQSANNVTSVSVTADKTSNISDVGESVQIYAIGILSSGATKDLSLSATWSKTSGTADVVLETISSHKYARFGFNGDKETKSATIRATYKGVYGSIILTQSASSAICGNLYINWSSAISGQTYYINYTGADIMQQWLSAYAVGGQLYVFGKNLDTWGGLDYWSIRKMFGVYSTQDDSSLLETFNLTSNEVDSLKGGTDVEITI